MTFLPAHVRRASQLSAAIWIAVLAMTVPPLLGWGKYIPETSGIR